MAFLRLLISRLLCLRFRRASAAQIHGYGDMVIDSSAPARHTKGY
jgi:hypothetical protein